MGQDGLFDAIRVGAMAFALALSIPSWRRAQRVYSLTQADPALSPVTLAYARERSIFLLVYAALLVSGLASLWQIVAGPTTVLAGTAVALALYEVAEWDKRRHLDVSRATGGAFHPRGSLLEALWMAVPVALVDLRTGIILSSNQAFERLFGYRMLGELRGQSVERLVPAERIEQSRMIREALARGESVPSMDGMIGLRKTGATFPVSVIVKPLVVDDVRAALVVCDDMSDTPRRRGDDV